MLVLKVEHISGGYDQTPILHDISFQVNKGEFLGILGPNGCGKSTLIKMISGILKPASGKVLIDGVPIEKLAPRELAKKMTVLPQIQGNAFSATVRETVEIGRYPHQRGIFSTWSEEDEKAVIKAMELTDVKKYQDTNLDFLSGGERQRVFIAQALAQSSELLLLDEPTNHLDLESIQALNNGLIAFKGAMIFTSHDHQFIQTIANRIIEIQDDGSIIDKQCTYDEFLEWKEAQGLL